MAKPKENTKVNLKDGRGFTNGKAKEGTATTEVQQVFMVNNVYLKAISYLAPHAPEIFNEAWKPKTDFKIQLNSRVLSESNHIYEVVLEVIATVQSGEGNALKEALKVDVKQAGAFTVKGFNEDELKRVLLITCPTLLFPYIREAIANIANRGGFPQLMLPPIISFDAIYAAQLKAQQEKEGK